MVLRKSKADLSLVNRGVFQKRKCVANGEGSSKKTSESVDHWAFLEEIEAPMWVDLTVETESMHQDIHDAWFQVTHPFHQYPAHELMSALSLSREGNRNSNSELLGSYSPMPPSVSRSRGKDYRSRKWGEGNHVGSLNKQQPIGSLGGKISKMVRESVQEIEPKYKFGNQKDPATKKESSICLSSSTTSMRSNSSKMMSTFRETKSSSFVKSSVIGDSNSTSTTGNQKSSSNFRLSFLTENNQQQLQESSEVPHQTSGLTTGFILAESIRLTRTGVTRPPSRVEIKQHSNCNKSSSSKPSVLPNLNPVKQSNGRKSSSSKSSSVGSSKNPRCDLKATTLAAVVNNETTPESRTVISFGQAAKHPKKKASNVSKTSRIQDRGLTSISQLGGKALDGKSTNRRSRTEPTNALRAGKIQQSSHVYMKAEEPAGTRSSKTVIGSKNVNAGQISSGKENAAGDIPGQKPTKHSVKVKNGMGLSDVKRKTKRGNRSTNPVDTVRRIYFR